MDTDELMRDDAGNPVLTKDGKPRRKPGPAKGTPAAPRRRTGTGTSSKSGGRGNRRKSYKQDVLGLFQIATLPLAVAGTKNPVILADAAAVTIHAEPISEAVDHIAQEQPQVAAVLERLTKAGPYAVLISALTPLVMQLAVNHKALPLEVGSRVGAHDPEQLVDWMRQQTEGAQDASTNGQA